VEGDDRALHLCSRGRRPAAAQRSVIKGHPRRNAAVTAASGGTRTEHSRVLETEHQSSFSIHDILVSLKAMIDRISPSRRPDERAVGWQSWRELLFAHWPVPPELLRPLIPERLSIDTFEGQTFIGLVPFSMEGVRPWWMPMGMDFLETNLRAYVHLEGQGPGVWFFSLEAASWLAVQAARIGWGLPYHHATMLTRREGAVVDYRTVRASQPEASLTVQYEIGAELGPSEPGTLEHFLLERYLLYARRGGRLLRGQVHHVPYPARAANILSISEGIVSAAGLPPTDGIPPIVHCSPGVDVEVFALRTV
jgi:uncharacterized protein YqjF (DUF2071 family)